MLDALERVLKGLKPLGRGPLPSALIEISLSRFYYLGMDAVAHSWYSAAHRHNPGVTDKPPCIRRGNKRLYHTSSPAREARPPHDSLSDIHTVGQNNTIRLNERE